MFDDHIPGADDAAVDRLVAVEAARRIVGPSTDGNLLLWVARPYTDWLGQGRDQTNRGIRRRVLLMVAAERRGLSEREARDLVKLAEIVRKYVTRG